MTVARLLQVGAGSGGMAVLDALIRDPRIHQVTLIEPDHFSRSNLDRHLFGSHGVGRLKADLAREWCQERRPDLQVDLLPVDLTDPTQQSRIREAAAAADLGVCAADNEVAKYHFDRLMREAGKPWTLGEVLSGGIGGWIHRFPVDGPCYGCVASHLQRAGPPDTTSGPAPDYADPQAVIAETRIPASKAAIAAIASLHAIVTLDLLAPTNEWSFGNWNSYLFPLSRVPGVFEEAFRGHRIAVPKALSCLVCSQSPIFAAGEDLDAALEQALDRLAHE